ncbi:MAG: sigma-70 family RNA polymerase sigma factor [Candidatus Omnitrophica bacterium]|nr:sigma-70 family RNA polymerase sigma factor [Candidatus Omnitrophota bacterium]
MLLARTAAGEKAAFNEIIRKYQTALINFIYRLVGDRHLSEEIAQETFLRIYQSASHYKPKAKFSTYLYQVAKNVALNVLRHRKFVTFFQQPFPLLLNFQLKTEESEQENRQQLRQLVQQALNKLPFAQRTAIILAKYEGLSYEEIASVMKTSVPAVKSLIYRAKETLKKTLTPLVSSEGQLEYRYFLPVRRVSTIEGDTHD